MGALQTQTEVVLGLAFKPSRSVHTHTVNYQNAPAQTTSSHAAVDRNTTYGPKSFIIAQRELQPDHYFQLFFFLQLVTV